MGYWVEKYSPFSSKAEKGWERSSPSISPQRAPQTIWGREPREPSGLPLPLFHPNLPVLVASSQEPDPKSGPNLMEKDHQFVKPASGAAETQGNPHSSHILFDLGKRSSSVT